MNDKSSNFFQITYEPNCQRLGSSLNDILGSLVSTDSRFTSFTPESDSRNEQGPKSLRTQLYLFSWTLVHLTCCSRLLPGGSGQIGALQRCIYQGPVARCVWDLIPPEPLPSLSTYFSMWSFIQDPAVLIHSVLSLRELGLTLIPPPAELDGTCRTQFQPSNLFRVHGTRLDTAFRVQTQPVGSCASRTCSSFPLVQGAPRGDGAQA